MYGAARLLEHFSSVIQPLLNIGVAVGESFSFHACLRTSILFDNPRALLFNPHSGSTYFLTVKKTGR